MKRDNEGNYCEITWEEALATVADKMKNVNEK